MKNGYLPNDELYAMLDGIAPSPLNAMNRAVAIAEWQGPEAGLALLKAVEPPPWLLGYYLWNAVLGELHRRAGHNEEARRYTERALTSAPTDAERGVLRQRLASLKLLLPSRDIWLVSDRTPLDRFPP